MHPQIRVTHACRGDANEHFAGARRFQIERQRWFSCGDAPAQWTDRQRLRTSYPQRGKIASQFGAG
jgi:hypothetical protein